MKGLAPALALKKRPKVIRKWSIVECVAVKIIQSESYRFFLGEVCRRQLVFLVVNFLASENEII